MAVLGNITYVVTAPDLVSLILRNSKAFSFNHGGDGFAATTQMLLQVDDQLMLKMHERLDCNVCGGIL